MNVLSLALLLSSILIERSAVPAAGGATAVDHGRAKLIEGALAQVGRTPHYDGSYQVLPYPGGDVPIERGVCSDVIVRAFRHAGLDLQVLVHEDMARDFRAYPRQWGLRSPDKNIDHRRVPNLATFFRRQGKAVPVTSRGADYAPGDIVTWQLSPGIGHIGIVTDRPVPGTDRFLIVHNIGSGTRLEDMLFAYPVTAHFRYF